MAAIKGQAQRPHFPRHHRTNTGWQEHANCANTDPDIFFDPDRYHLALIVCAECPVQQPCRDFGRSQTDGVWGGRIHQQYKRKARR